MYFGIASHAVAELHSRGETLQIAPQNFVEFRNVATRPVANNGLGLTPAAAEAKAAILESTFPLLIETPAIYPNWKVLVQAFGVIGKQVHDARLVAIAHVHGVSHVLTFNTKHFVRFAGYGPRISVIDPVTV
jgi:hypothetical protein